MLINVSYTPQWQRCSSEHVTLAYHCGLLICLQQKLCLARDLHLIPLVILQADSEHLDYEYRADAEYPSPEDSLIHSVINAAQVKNSSSFMVSATHLAGNTAQGAGGGIFATSQAGV